MQNDWELFRLKEDTTIKPFTCGESELDSFLLHDAKKYLKHLGYVTYIIESSDKTVAYFSLANDAIPYTAIDDFWEEIREELDAEKHNFLKDNKVFPAVKIGRLAVHTDYQKSGIGTDIIKYLIHSFTHNNKTGCQFITVDAINKPDTNKFYLRNKFQYFTNNDSALPTRQMYRCLLSPEIISM